MHQGKLVFAQVMAHLPLSTFRRCVARYDGEHKVKSFSCLDQFYAMAFAQLTFRESLRDIEACLATQGQRLYHLGFRSPVARNTLANANAVRPWQIYAELAQHLIGIARPLYADEPIGLDLKETVYAFDATTTSASTLLTAASSINGPYATPASSPLPTFSASTGAASFTSLYSLATNEPQASTSPTKTAPAAATG